MMHRLILALALLLLASPAFGQPGLGGGSGSPGLRVFATGGDGTVGVASGSGTTNRLMKFDASDDAADSLLSDDGTNVTLTSGRFLNSATDSAAAPGYSLIDATGIYNRGSNLLIGFATNTDGSVLEINTAEGSGGGAIYAKSDWSFAWSSGVPSAAGPDTELKRVAAGGVGIGDNANGKSVNIRSLTELTTIAAAATTSTTIQIPANALVIGVTVRVTVVIPTAATFDLGVTGATTRYGSGISAAATTTNSSPGTTNPTIYGSAVSILFTPNLTPADNSGRVRTTIYYIDATVPTS